ncbi:MAG: hypothetical protein JOY90_08130 [Bradyrhizobium sp.]|uniref:hypothetical protein n=1 Tax=Bradyrhizobium sp. TaxID=376 RepID=UPI001D6A89EC|nr:hypothetical protein [Bradyrhizobium sp.]MBV9560412.1 hypothetical protein [Bradyrhizobium sp.]
MFDLIISKRGGRSRWEWRVCDLSSGKVVMAGGERSRSAARYEGARALFLLLLSSHRAAVAVRGPRG